MAKPETYHKVRLLGEGSFGKAYLVKGEHTGEYSVIKEIVISGMTEEEKKDVQKEAEILKSLNHPNIIALKEAYKTKRGNLCIVMEFANGDIW